MQPIISYSSQRANLHPSYYKKGFKETNELRTTICNYVWSPIIWNDGVRGEDNFLSADFGVLDIDDGMPIDEALIWLEKKKLNFILAPTKSHQKQKKKKPPKDRYRLIMKFKETITDLDVYKYNMRLLASSWGGDRQCCDGARFFYPSMCIPNTCFDGHDIPVQQVPPPSPTKTTRIRDMVRYRASGRLPNWLNNFLNKGMIFGDGRQYTCFSAACKMFELGINETAVVQRIHASPFDRNNFRSTEIDQAIRSARRRIR